MTFYKQKCSRSILYENSDDKIYRIDTYTEEYPNGRTETVTGDIKRVDNKPRFVGIDNDEIESVNRENIPFSVIETLKRKFDEEQVP